MIRASDRKDPGVSTAVSDADRNDAVSRAAKRLLHARRTAVPCAPIRDLLPTDDIDQAYAVQARLTDDALRHGRRIVGRKIGLTSPSVQRQLGVDQPDFGVLFQDMQCCQDQPIDVGMLLQPRIEAEIAFVLGEDLDVPITTRVVRDAITYAMPALEIVDSRIEAWDITIVDTIADNASSGLFVLGDEQVPLDELDLPAIAVRLEADGETVSTGSGADCMGNPLTAATWLAETSRRYGSPLRARDIILSGALGPVVPIAAGSDIRAEMVGLGTVRAVFG